MHLQIEPKEDHWKVELKSIGNPTLEGAIKDMEIGMSKLKEEFEMFKVQRKKGAIPLVCPQN